MLRTILAATAAIAASCVALPALACGGDYPVTFHPDGTTTCGTQQMTVDTTDVFGTNWDGDIGLVTDEHMQLGEYVEVVIVPEEVPQIEAASSAGAVTDEQSSATGPVLEDEPQPLQNRRGAPSQPYRGRSSPKQTVEDNRNGFVQMMEAVKDALDGWSMAGGGGDNPNTDVVNATETTTTYYQNGQVKSQTTRNIQIHRRR